jgi:hypothetical protein
MKKLALIAALAVSTIMSAQRVDKNSERLLETPTITYQQNKYMLNNVSKDATTVTVIADEKEFSKDFKEFLKSTLAIEGKKNGAFTTATNVTVPQWSSEPLTFHYRTEKDGSNTKLIVITEQNGAVITPESNPDLAAKVSPLN